MKAHRVWCTWPDDPESDAMASAAFELPARAAAIAEASNKGHAAYVRAHAGDPDATPRAVYVVREEEIPRDIVFQGRPDRVVMVFLGEDATPTDVSKR